jgi:peptidoglycan/LPS O-acetylase OafA/YrhL
MISVTSKTQAPPDVQAVQSRRLHYVDALRGLAALVVMFHHTTTLFPDLYAALAPVAPLWHQALMFLSDRNHDAVMLFFVLSGFAVRLSSGPAGLQTTADIDQYLYRRFKRIVPLFLVALILTAAVGLWLARASDPAYGVWTLFGNLVFLQSSSFTRGTWFVPYGGNGPLWSLSYEMFYYLLYPVLVCVLRPWQAFPRGLRFAAAWVLTGIGLALFVLAPAPPLSFLSLFGIWYCGVDLAEHHLTARRDRPWQIAVLVCGACLSLLIMPRLPSATMQSWAAGAAIYAVWRAGLSLQRGPVGSEATGIRYGRVLIAPLTGLGFISYALYLFHYPLLTAAASVFGQSWAVLAATTVLALAIAYAAEQLAVMPRYLPFKQRYVGWLSGPGTRRA